MYKFWMQCSVFGICFVLVISVQVAYTATAAAADTAKNVEV